MCRWDLSPAILLLFPADWDCKSPPVTPPWGELAHGFGSSKPDRHWPGQAPWEPRSRNADWEKKKKTKRKRSWSAGALWFVSRGAPQEDVGSAAQGALPGEESSPLCFSLFHIFLVEPEEHLESPPSLGYHTFKGYLLKEHLSGARIESVLHGHGGWWFRMSVQRQGISEN